MFGQPQRLAELADLVLVKIAQRFNDFALGSKFSHECRVVVVRLDDVSFCRGQVRAALNEIRTQSALRQIHTVGLDPKLAHCIFRHAHEGIADNHALVLRSGAVFERAHRLSLGALGVRRGKLGAAAHHVKVNVDFGQRLLHSFALVLAHEAVVNVDGMDASGADSLPAESGAHRRVHTAGDKHQNFLVANCLADLFQRGLVPAFWREVRSDAADTLEKVFDHFPAVGCEVDLGVELRAVELSLRTLDAHNVPP